MQKLPISQIQPGMILAKPVLNDKGMTLCSEGTELTETLIERLRVMNITVLAVKGHPVDSGGPAKSLEDRLREMSARFARVEGDPVMDRLRDAVASAMRVQDSEMRAQEEKESGEASHE